MLPAVTPTLKGSACAASLSAGSVQTRTVPRFERLERDVNSAEEAELRRLEDGQPPLRKFSSTVGLPAASSAAGRDGLGPAPYCRENTGEPSQAADGKDNPPKASPQAAAPSFTFGPKQGSNSDTSAFQEGVFQRLGAMSSELNSNRVALGTLQRVIMEEIRKEVMEGLKRMRKYS